MDFKNIFDEEKNAEMQKILDLISPIEKRHDELYDYLYYQPWFSRINDLVVINIRNDSKTRNLADKTQFVYSMSFNENKKVAIPVTTPASSKLVGVNLGVPTINSIPQKSDLSTDLAKQTFCYT